MAGWKEKADEAQALGGSMALLLGTYQDGILNECESKTRMRKHLSQNNAWRAKRKILMNNKTSTRSLSLKEKVVLYLNYEGDKRLGGLSIVLYRLTGGRITRPWKVNVLILTTRGRKTGKTRRVLLQFFPDGANMILVAANSGRSSHPGWFYNLKATPMAQVQVMARISRVRAEELSTEEATAFWPRVLQVAPTYARYQQATSRTIPLVRLIPVEQAGPRRLWPSREALCAKKEVSYE